MAETILICLALLFYEEIYSGIRSLIWASIGSLLKVETIQQLMWILGPMAPSVPLLDHLLSLVVSLFLFMCSTSTLYAQPLQLTEFQLPHISVLLGAHLGHHFLHYPLKVPISS